MHTISQSRLLPIIAEVRANQKRTLQQQTLILETKLEKVHAASTRSGRRIRSLKQENRALKQQLAAERAISFRSSPSLNSARKPLNDTKSAVDENIGVRAAQCPVPRQPYVPLLRDLQRKCAATEKQLAETEAALRDVQARHDARYEQLTDTLVAAEQQHQRAAQQAARTAQLVNDLQEQRDLVQRRELELEVKRADAQRLKQQLVLARLQVLLSTDKSTAVLRTGCKALISVRIEFSCREYIYSNETISME